MLNPEHINRIFIKKKSTITQGLGADFSNVLSLLHLYELGLCSGVETDYQNTGNYYDPRYGENWWNYYFEPLKVGEEKGSSFCEHPSFLNGAIANLVASREDNYALIQKYIRIKPHILQKVNSATQAFGSFTLGLFHRGTDKHIEAPTMTYEEVIRRTQEILTEINFVLPNYTLFVSSDEERFIETISPYFPNALYLKDKFRSTNEKPIHSQCPDRYKAGEDALLDCLLFSKTDLMVRMDSNLGQIATFFSPRTPEILLNPGYYKASPERIAKYQLLKKRVKIGENINQLVQNSSILC